jgi:hypothetical protein
MRALVLGKQGQSYSVGEMLVEGDVRICDHHTYELLVIQSGLIFPE